MRRLTIIVGFGMIIIFLLILGAAIIGDESKVIPTDSHELRLLLVSYAEGR